MKNALPLYDERDKQNFQKILPSLSWFLYFNSGTRLYTFQSSMYSINMETRFHPAIKRAPVLVEAKCMICPVAIGATKLLNKSIRRRVAVMASREET